MYQLSRRHRVVTKGWASTTSAFDRSIRWPVDHVCSAKADAAISPFWIARRCSDNRCFRVLPDWPMYTLGQPEQGMWYTTPARWSLGCWCRVQSGQNCLSLLKPYKLGRCIASWGRAWGRAGAWQILAELRGRPVTLQMENSFKCGTIMRRSVLIRWFFCI